MAINDHRRCAFLLADGELPKRPPTDRLRAQVESQLSMKTLADNGDFSLMRWFHDNGVSQATRLENEMFKYG